MALVYKFDVTLFTGFCRIIKIKEDRMYHFDAEAGTPPFRKKLKGDAFLVFLQIADFLDFLFF
jgi:hypothetical protein